MKTTNQAITIIKDLIISILIVICIVLIISVIFYDKISLTKVIPESEEYLLTDEMQGELKQKENQEEIITTYYIDEQDIKKNEKENIYTKGKVDPFEYKDKESLTNSIQYYEDDGTK